MRRKKRLTMAKSRNGELLVGEEQMRKRWKEHFQQLLNKPPQDYGGARRR